MKYMTAFQNKTALQAVIIHDMRNCGIIVSQSSLANDCIFTSNQRSIFGCCLCHLPTYDIPQHGAVPCFLVDSIDLLRHHQQTEGLFRLSGSSARQKDLKQKVEEGFKLPSTAAPHDVACLLKQFIREIPNSLIPIGVHNVMIQCYQNLPAEQQLHYLLLSCLLLSRERIIALRFLLHFLWSFSLHSQQNRMDINNIVVCLAPNVFHSWFCTGSNVDNSMRVKIMQAQNDILRLLVENASQVGMVNDSIIDRMSAWTSYFSSDDELDSTDKKKNCSADKKQKKRRSSLKGLVTSLSSSFSRWRRDSKGHNSSNVSEHVSTLSCPNIGSDDTIDENCNSQALCGSSTFSVIDVASIGMATPKMMQKRKGDDNIAFSAAKRRAILQNLPNMSALASNAPFTPLANEKSEDMKGNISSLSVDNTGCTTPRQKLEKLLMSPSCKPRRKSGRFSPSKRRHRGSFCGNVVKLLRRMSGGKGNTEQDKEECVSSPLLVSGEVADTVAFSSIKGSRVTRKTTRDCPVQLLAATNIRSKSTLSKEFSKSNSSMYNGDVSLLTMHTVQKADNVQLTSETELSLAELSSICKRSDIRENKMEKVENSSVCLPSEHVEYTAEVNEDIEGERLDISLHDEAFLEQSVISCKEVDSDSVFNEPEDQKVSSDCNLHTLQMSPYMSAIECDKQNMAVNNSSNVVAGSSSLLSTANIDSANLLGSSSFLTSSATNDSSFCNVAVVPIDHCIDKIQRVPRYKLNNRDENVDIFTADIAKTHKSYIDTENCIRPCNNVEHNKQTHFNTIEESIPPSSIMVDLKSCSCEIENTSACSNSTEEMKSHDALVSVKSHTNIVSQVNVRGDVSNNKSQMNARCESAASIICNDHSICNTANNVINKNSVALLSNQLSPIMPHSRISHHLAVSDNDDHDKYLIENNCALSVKPSNPLTDKSSDSCLVANLGRMPVFKMFNSNITSKQNTQHDKSTPLSCSKNYLLSESNKACTPETKLLSMPRITPNLLPLKSSNRLKASKYLSETATPKSSNTTIARFPK